MFERGSIIGLYIVRDSLKWIKTHPICLHLGVHSDIGQQSIKLSMGRLSTTGCTPTGLPTPPPARRPHPLGGKDWQPQGKGGEGAPCQEQLGSHPCLRMKRLPRPILQAMWDGREAISRDLMKNQSPKPETRQALREPGKKIQKASIRAITFPLSPKCPLAFGPGRC